MAKWNTNKPKCKPKNCSDEYLITIDKGRYKRILKAVYIPYKHCTIEDMGWNMWDGIPDDWEYIEEEDSWWIPEGWYEINDYFDDYSYAYVSDPVLAWTKLPKPYEPSLNVFDDNHINKE